MLLAQMLLAAAFLAVAILLIVVKFADAQSTKFANTNVPNPAGGN